VAKAVVVANAVPPVATSYQFNAVPVATKFATVAESQNACANAVGAGVVLIVTATAVLMLSQVFNVWVT
jgi:hypothetical protein